MWHTFTWSWCCTSTRCRKGSAIATESWILTPQPWTMLYTVTLQQVPSESTIQNVLSNITAATITWMTMSLTINQSINHGYFLTCPKHLALRPSLLQVQRSGAHYRPSVVVCPSVFVTLDAPLRQYYSCDSALSAIEMHCIILRYINFLFYSTLSSKQLLQGPQGRNS